MGRPVGWGWWAGPKWLRATGRWAEQLAEHINRNEDPEERLNRLEALSARQIQIFGPDGGPAANAREMVAAQLEKMDRFAEARLLREEVVAAFRRNRGEEDEYTLLAEEWLGTNLAKSGMSREARLLY